MDLERPDTHQKQKCEISVQSDIPSEGEQGILAEEAQGILTEEMQRILLERAKEYAEVLEDEAELKETIRLITFSICGENYGIELRCINEVRILPRITPIPCTPPFVKGAVNIRGKIFSVIDVRTFLNISSDAQNEFNKVLIVEAANLELGVLVDDVINVVDIPLAEIKPPTDVLLRSRTEHIRGVYIRGVTEESVIEENAAEEMLIILDIQSLFSTPDIIVYEEV